MTTVKRYYFFDQPIDFLAPSRSRSAFVAEADYLVLQQAAQEAAKALQKIAARTEDGAPPFRGIDLITAGRIAMKALTALEQAVQ